jgi:hypothetical protein
MNTRFLVFAVLPLLAMPALPFPAQSLADAARQEQARRQNKKSSSKVFTNDDLSRYEEPQAAAAAQPTEPAATATRSEGLGASDGDERAWSKRFIDAKAKVQQAKSQGQALELKLNDLNLKLMASDPQAGNTVVFDRENLYLPLIAQTKEKIEKNKSDLATSEAELEELRGELRRSGNPISWADSQLALQPENKGGKAEPAKVKDQKYWMEQLGVIDKRYNALIAPLEEQRFQLIHRRPSAEGESTAPTEKLGMGVPPGVIDINVQVKELNQKRDQEKAALIEKALHEGALPGWFR